MSLLVSILGAIVAIFVVVILHEMGHFFVARCFGIKILRFSIGFGKALYKRCGKDGTEYVLAAIPLGGYVKMLGEGDAQDISDDEQHMAYHQKPLLVRMAVVAAGPLTNLLLAFVVFWVALMIGTEHVKPVVGEVLPNSFAAASGIQPGDEIVKVGDTRTNNWQQVIISMLVDIGSSAKIAVHVKPENSAGYKVRQFDLSHWVIDDTNPDMFELLGMLPKVLVAKPVVKTVALSSPAAKAGIKPHDEIVAINDKTLVSWEQLVTQVRKMPGQAISLTLSNSRQELRQLPVTLGSKKLEDRNLTVGYLGITAFPPVIPATLLYTERYGPLAAIFPAMEKSALMVKYNAIFLVKLLTAKLSIKTMGGPISIFQAAAQASKAGWEIYLGFIGFVSITVGFINVLPIPGLDGGHLLFQVIEGVRRRPVSAKVQHYAFTLGMLLVLFVVVRATINDLIRIFGG